MAFEYLTRTVVRSGEPSRQFGVKCARCPTVYWYNRGRNGHEGLTFILRGKGWSAPGTKGQACPACARGRRSMNGDSTPERRQAAYLHIRETEMPAGHNRRRALESGSTLDRSGAGMLVDNESTEAPLPDLLTPQLMAEKLAALGRVITATKDEPMKDPSADKDQPELPLGDKPDNPNLHGDNQATRYVKAPAPGGALTNGPVTSEALRKKWSAQRAATKWLGRWGVETPKEDVHYIVAGTGLSNAGCWSWMPICAAVPKAAWDAYIVAGPIPAVFRQPPPTKEPEPMTAREDHAALENLSNPPPLRAEPPRACGPVDKRRIREAIERNYNEEKGRWNGSGSAAAMALTLDVPVAWVRDVLEGYGPDRNEEPDNAKVKQWRIALAQRIETTRDTVLELIRSEYDAMIAELRAGPK